VSVSRTIDRALIHRRRDARAVDLDTVTAIAASIESGSLIHPLLVRRMGDDFELIAGSHRFAALDSLEMDIPCIVVEADDLHAELMMIDENLCRAELSPSDRAQQTARRKAIYLELHPNTGHGKASPNKEDKLSTFADATAALTGADARTVRRDAERGEKIVPEALEAISGTSLDKGVYLDRLKSVPTDQQVETTKRDLEAASQPRPAGGIASRYASTAASQPALAPKPTYEQAREALVLLGKLTADDFIAIWPAPKRAALCTHLAGLVTEFEAVMARAAS